MDTQKRHYFDYSIDEVVTVLNEHTQRLVNNPAEALRANYRAGICNMDGSFTEPYKELEKYRVSKQA